MSKIEIMTTRTQLATRVRRTLTSVLPPGVRVFVVPRADGSPTFDVTVQTGAADHRFLAGWAGKGWPADVEELVRASPGVEIAVAAEFSHNARVLLDQRGIGWIDESGLASITRPSGLIISREPIRESVMSPSPIKWSRSTLAVAEAALSGVTPTVESIEEATGLSRHATAIGLAQLERLGLLARPTARRGPKSGRQIVDYADFLDNYSKVAIERRSRQKVLRFHRLWEGNAVATLRTEIAPALSTLEHHWAVTGTAASQLIAPYLSDVTTLDLYVDPELMSNTQELELRLGARIVQRGQVIEVRELPTLMSEKGPVLDSISVALPVRVYADLLGIGGRSAEAAQHLREELHVGPAA